MEKVINVLSEIEDKASKILDRTQDQKQQLYEQLNKDLAKLETDIKADTTAKIDAVQKDMELDIASERKKLLADCQHQIDDLQQSYEKNHDQLVDSIFQSILEA